MEDIKSIVLGGKEYPISSFSPQVQQLSRIMGTWEKELAEARLKVALYDAALREANREITDLLVKELQQQSQAKQS